MLFEIEISGEPGAYQVEVLHSEGGGRPRERLVLDPVSILRHRTELENAVLASSVQSRRIVPAAEEPLRMVGQQLFEALFTGHVYGAYRASLGAAQQQQKRLGVVLRIVEPELAALPWEALFDPETEEYLCRSEPLIRHVDAPYTAEPLEVRPPLRILGLVASPRGLPILDVAAERQRLEQALAKPRAAGLVELAWAPDVSWEGIHEQMLSDTWHILHFVGHGDYDVIRQEGVLALVGPDGGADLIEAGRLRDLLCEAEPTPRLVVLNSCSSGEAGVGDLFSGTAAALVQRGISAVAAMQFSITDGAAIRFARGFYTAIAHGRPVDEAVRSGRVGILGSARTLEWITPVLYVKTDSAQLFRLTGMAAPDTGTALDTETAPGTGIGADMGVAANTGTAPGTGIATGTATDTGIAVATGTAAYGHPAGRTGEKPPGRPGRGPRPRRRRRWLLAAAAITAAAAVIIGIVVTAGSHGSSGSPSGWPYSTGFSVYTRPYLVNGTIYVGNTSGHVYALNASTGAFRWRYPRGSAIGAVYSRPGVADHMVYVGSDNGLIYAIRARDGAAVWSSRCDENGDAVRSSPVFVDGVIYASTRGGSVCALKADDGSRFWDRPVLLGTTVPASSPEVSRHLPGSPPSQVLLYLGSDNGHVYALSGRTGKIQWQFPRSGQPGLGALAAQPAISSDGSVVYAGSNDGHLYALDADTGRLDWKYPATAQGLDGAIGAQPAVAAFSTTVYFASGFGVYAITGRGGKPSLTWKTDPVELASNTGQSGPVATAGDVYVGSGKHVVCLDASNGSLCWHPPFTADSRVVTTPVVGNGVDTIYVGTLDGNVYALTPGGRVLRAR